VKKELFARYINNLVRDYNTQLRLSLKRAKEEPVHDLRVLIKRFNTLFVFLLEAGIYKGTSQIFFKQLRQFFKSAGKLRDIHVQKSLIRKYRHGNEMDLTGYETYLASKENTAKSCFLSNAANYPKKEQILVKNDIIGSVKSFKQDELSIQATTFILKRLGLIEKYLFQSNIDKYLHKIRQTLKQLRYFIEMVHNCTDPNPLEEIDFNEIKEIESILGNWNDCSVLCQDLKRYRKYMRKLNTGFSDPDISRLLEGIQTDMKKQVSDVRPRLLKLAYHLKYLML
jgi:CHAD domain-containing protein